MSMNFSVFATPEPPPTSEPQSSLQKLRQHIEQHGTPDARGVKSLKVTDGNVYFLELEAAIRVRVVGAGSYPCHHMDAVNWCRILGIL